MTEMEEYRELFREADENYDAIVSMMKHFYGNAEERECWEALRQEVSNDCSWWFMKSLGWGDPGGIVDSARKYPDRGKLLEILKR